MELARTVEELRLHADAWRALKRTIALVPTMGALHEGHLSLVETARRHADEVIVSIFVNPAQFAPGEDLSRYPRDIEGDLQKLRKAGADLAYVPGVEEIYPPGFATTIVPGGPALAGLEDAFRPDHFSGVATVVAKLFIQSRADMAVFGEKDWQQLQVVRAMTRDLDLPVKIIAAPTMREEDGLAMSSRNAYLSPQERRAAPLLHRALLAAARAIADGTNPRQACADAARGLREAGLKVDYFELRHAETLAPVEDASAIPAEGAPLRLLAAARLGATRLIDNIAAPAPAHS